MINVITLNLGFIFGFGAEIIFHESQKGQPDRVNIKSSIYVLSINPASVFIVIKGKIYGILYSIYI